MTKTERRYKAFVEAYISNGRNAKQAYLTISPKVTESTAEVEGARYLRKPKISEKIDLLESQLSESSQVTRQSQLQELRELKERNIEKKDRLVLEAIKEENKMLGFLAPEQHENLNKNVDMEVTDEDRKDIKKALDQLGDTSKEESSG